jgi:1-acyl-sn-glycerol-3-phosphate acyltransferase
VRPLLLGDEKNGQTGYVIGVLITWGCFATSIVYAAITYYFWGLWSDLSTLWVPFLLWIAFYLVQVSIYLLICWIGGKLIDLNKPARHVDPFAMWIIHEGVYFILFWGRVHIHFQGMEKVPYDRTCLIVSNHISGWDHLCIFTRLYVKYHMTILSLSKKELEHVFAIGPWMHKAGFVPIDRNDPIQGLKCIVQCIDYIKTGEASIVLAPEGTRSKTGLVGEFHPGSFKVATKSQCPIVVCSIQGTDKIKKNFPWKGTRVDIRVLAVWQPADYQSKDTVAISEEARTLIRKELKQLD